MRTISVVSIASFALFASFGLAGCAGDDNSVPPPTPDSGADATVPTDGGGDGSTEASPDTGPLTDAPADAADAAVDAPSVGPFVTVSYTFDSFAQSAYAAFDVPAGAVQGTLTYAQFGTNLSTNTSPWVLEQANDLVLRMDPAAPWKVLSSWNVSEPPPPDAGGPSYSYSDAFSVAEVGTKAYVALFTRDVIAVLDTSAAVDGGAPLKAIDLSQFVADADVDRALEATAIFYDKTQSLVWVVLGNTDQAVSAAGYPTVCVPGFNPLVVAIDPTTDTIVSGKTYALKGFDVYPGSAVAFDQANDRLLAVSQGCSDATTESDGGVVDGPTVESYVEELALGTGVDTILVNPAPSGAGGLIYVDATHAFIQSSGGVNAWDPTQATVGALVANAPDAIVWDGKGHLLGPKATTLSDGGTSFSIISVDTADGGVTTLATNPFAPPPDPSSYAWEGVDLWPRP